MKKLPFISCLILLIVCGVNDNTFSWGFWAHKKINHQAVFTLPSGMIGFYKNHIDYLTKHSTDADKRRNIMPDEAPRHYINPERFGVANIDSIPEKWSDAVLIYGYDSLKEYGILPWYVMEMMYQLTNAFKERNVDRILKCSANMGHYIADAHVPLHVTSNYNGQMTGQEGIHAFWESRIPELFGDGYDYLVGKASYIHDPLKTIWQVVADSYSAKDSVLEFEKRLNDSFPSDKKFVIEKKGKKLIKVISKEYAEAYNSSMNGMIERRMRASILLVGSLWYTAWVNAGQPDMLPIETLQASDSLNVPITPFERLVTPIKTNNNGHVD